MIIKEGKAIIKIPEIILSKKAKVFYNPSMKINRDFTILILKAYYELRGKKLDILDSMAATGIRSIRIIKEIPEVINSLKIVDIKEDAIKNIRENFEINNIKNNYEILKEDCRIVMYKNKFDYIDIDPFGSPIGYIQPAIFSLKNNGIIGVTATDISSLSASKQPSAFKKYNIIGFKTDFYLEFGIRVLAKYIIEEGLKFDIGMIPIFSYYYQHHYRIFFVKSKKSKDISYVLNNIKYIYYCKKCHYKSSEEKKCINCNTDMEIIGPIYIGSLYNDYFVEYLYGKKILDLDKNERKILERIYNCDSKKELWYYYDIRYLSKAQKISLTPKIEKILEKTNGCRTHFSDFGIKCECYPILK